MLSFALLIICLASAFLAIIGAGGAGCTAANSAVKMGKRVALVERDKLGGTCLNYGCDPTKTLLHTVHLLYRAQHAFNLGLIFPQDRADWTKVQAHVRQAFETILSGTLAQANSGIAAQGIDRFMGKAGFSSAHESRVNGKTSQGKSFIIATGTIHHLCVEMRGVREMAPTTRTTVWRGHFAEDATLRAEFFSACKFQHEDR